MAENLWGCLLDSQKYFLIILRKISLVSLLYHTISLRVGTVMDPKDVYHWTLEYASFCGKTDFADMMRQKNLTRKRGCTELFISVKSIHKSPYGWWVFPVTKEITLHKGTPFNSIVFKEGERQSWVKEFSSRLELGMALSSQVQKIKFYQPSPKWENGSPPYSTTPLNKATSAILVLAQKDSHWSSAMQTVLCWSHKNHQTSAFDSCSVLNKPKQNQMYHTWHLPMQMQMMAEKASFQTAEILLGDSCCCCPLTSSRLKDRNEGDVGSTSAPTASQTRTPFYVLTVAVYQHVSPPAASVSCLLSTQRIYSTSFLRRNQGLQWG